MGRVRWYLSSICEERSFLVVLFYGLRVEVYGGGPVVVFESSVALVF